MESERNEEARATKNEEEIKDVLKCCIIITERELKEASNVWTLVNTKLDIMRIKIREKLEERGMS